MARAIVCGGRDYKNSARVSKVMSAAVLRLGLSSIAQGGADGADRIAAEWAWDNKIPVATFNADWRAHKKAAGPIRNQRMLEEYKPDFVIAFQGGAGTSDMVSRATNAGVKVYTIDWTFSNVR